MLGLCCLLSGCYYVQATRGQIEVLSKRQPIDAILASPDTEAELGRRLRLVQAWIFTSKSVRTVAENIFP